MNWIRKHKFWTSVLTLIVVGLLLSIAGIVNSFAVGQVIGTYTVLGWIARVLVFRNKPKEVK